MHAFFSVLPQSIKKVNNFSDSAAEAYLNYGCSGIRAINQKSEEQNPE